MTSCEGRVVVINPEPFYAVGEKQAAVIFLQNMESVWRSGKRKCDVRNTASLNEIVGEFKNPDGIQEVCATADGTYNEDTSQLLVKLDSSLRPFAGQSNGIQADWLPDSETIKVSVHRKLLTQQK
jgi:hypothetical protein